MNSLSVDDYQTLSLQQQIFAASYRKMAEVCATNEALKPLQSGFLQMAARHELSGEFYRFLAQRIVDEREMKMIQSRQMKKILAMLVVVILLATGGVSLAQDSTPELTPPPSPLPEFKEGEVDAGDIVVVPADDNAGQPVVVIRESDTLPIWGWVLIGVIVILSLLLGTQGQTLIRPALMELSKNVSPAVFEVGVGAARAALDQAGKFVLTTPTPVDDAAYLELKQGYESLEQQMREIRALAFRVETNEIPDHK